MPFAPHLTPGLYLTGDVPGIGGIIRQRPEDFLVEELPAYEPCGEGEHLYMLIEKRDMATMHMVRVIANHFGVRPDAVGIAGLKDKRAITRQLVSVHVPGKTPADFPAFEHESISIHWIDQHTNKLRRGHLAGNRFVIRVREVSPASVVHAHRALARLARLGAPNRLGPQRFGNLGLNHEVGRALILEDHQRVLDLLLGPCATHPDGQSRAREAYAAGDLEQALAVTSRSARTERHLLQTLIRGSNPKRAVWGIDPAERSFFVTAFQSAIFNRVLQTRLTDGTFAQLLEGDLAFKHDNGAVFPIGAAELADASIAQRLARLEISPTGPMWGAQSMHAGGAVAQLERQALDESGVSLEQLAAHIKAARIHVEGARRPLRVPLQFPDVEGGVDEHGAYVKCRFELPRGAFATVVMDEIMKTGHGAEDDE